MFTSQIVPCGVPPEGFPQDQAWGVMLFCQSSCKQGYVSFGEGSRAPMQPPH